MQENPISDKEVVAMSPQDVISQQHAQIATLQASSVHKDALIAKSAGLIAEWQAKHRELEQAYDKRLQDFVALAADRAVADGVIHDLENRVASLIKKVDELNRENEKVKIESMQFAIDKSTLIDRNKSLLQEISEIEDVALRNREEIIRLSATHQVVLTKPNPELSGGSGEQAMLCPGLSVDDVQTAMAMTQEIAKLTLGDAVLSLKSDGTMRFYSYALSPRGEMAFMPAGQAIEAIKDALQFVSRPSVKIDIPLEYVAAVASGRPCHDFLHNIFQKTCVDYINNNFTES